jgi:hypothetical protein
VTEATQPWSGFKYQPVRGLTDRRIARYLRTQRKNMRRFFAERGMFDELEQMERIRKSRQGTVAKNEMFREVLDQYAAQTVQARAPIQGQMEPLQNVRAPANQSAVEIAPGPVAVGGMGAKEPGESEGDSLQVSGLSDSDPVIADDV